MSSADLASVWLESGLTTGLFGEIADIDTIWLDGTLYFAVTGRTGVELWSLTGAASPVLLTSQDILASPGTRSDTQFRLESGSATLLVSGGFLGGSERIEVDLSGAPPETVTLGGPARHTTAVIVDILGMPTFIHAEHGTGGLIRSTVESDGALTFQSQLSSAEASLLGPTTELQHVTISDRDYILALSPAAQHLGLVELLPGGAMALRDTIGAADGVPLAGPVSLAAVSIGDVYFALIGSAGTSSLTVVRIDTDGSLAMTDHVTDTLATRFQGATALTAEAGAGLAHVVAAGADDGLSYMVLMPNGRLIHAATIEDTTETALDGVTALSLTSDSDGLVLISGDEAGGLSKFRVAPPTTEVVLSAPTAGGTVSGGPDDEVLFGGAGPDSLFGNGGNDTLIDRAGADVLSGGAGADVFVFEDDGSIDRVADFDPSEDRLDLTGYSGQYSPEDLVISGTAGEMTVVVSDDTLILTAGAGVSLAEETVREAVLVSFERPFALPVERSLVGTDGSDTLLGGEASDTIDGAGGDDIIAGGEGDDVLYGGTGNDVIFGAGHTPEMIPQEWWLEVPFDLF